MSTYPIVNLANARSHVHAVRENPSQPHGRPKVEQRTLRLVALEDDVQDLIEDALNEFRRQFAARKGAHSSSQQKKDELEGQLVPVLHRALRDLPAEVLTDRDFWRYLATAELFDFVRWRDSKEGLPQDTSFGCSSNSLHPDTVPLRMFNRGEISVRGATDESDEYEVARIPGSDMWKSHILRPLNRYAPNAVASIASQVRDDSISSTRLRSMIKQIKRARANVLLEVLEPEDAEAFVRRENRLASASSED
jgi:hypothetical protein